MTTNQIQIADSSGAHHRTAEPPPSPIGNPESSAPGRHTVPRSDGSVLPGNPNSPSGADGNGAPRNDHPAGGIDLHRTSETSCSASIAAVEASSQDVSIEGWPEMLRAARIELANAIGSTEGCYGSFSKRAVEVLRPMLPYVLHPVGGDGLIWVNRQYKPIGGYSGYATYEAYPWVHVSPDDPRVADLLARLRKRQRDEEAEREQARARRSPDRQPSPASTDPESRSSAVRPKNAALYLFGDTTAPWINATTARNYLALLYLVDCTTPAHRAYAYGGDSRTPGARYAAGLPGMPLALALAERLRQTAHA